MSAKALWQDRRWQNAALCGLLLLVGLVLTLTSERIPVSGGLGFDGAEYGNWAMHFDKVLSREIPVSPYRMFRILPSGLAYGSLRLLGIALTPPHVIQFFQVFNLLLLGLAALAWGGIADAVGIRGQGKVLGFLALFANHAVLKFNFYYPVLTDTAAYTLALAGLYAYLRNRAFLLVAVTVAGAFCWPTMIVFGGILLLFPRQDHTPTTGKGLFVRLPALLVTGGYLAFVLHAQIQTPWYPLSVAIVTAYLFCGLWFLFGDPFFLRPRPFAQAFSLPRLAILLLVLLVFTLGRFLATAKAGNPVGTAHFNASVLEMIRAYAEGTCVPLSTRFPGEFLIAHTLYFGPVLLLAACFPRRVAQMAGRFGFGFLLLTTVAWLHAIMPLSRQWTAGYPVLVLATVLALEPWRLGRGFLLCFTALSLFVSKVWLRFNVVADAKVHGSSFDNAFAWTQGFSFDRYISSTGRWMAIDWYLVQTAGLLLVFWAYYWYFYAPRALPRDTGNPAS